MNHNAFKVISLLTKYPNEWMDTQSIAYDTDLTSRQVSSVVMVLDIPYLRKSRDRDNKMIVMFEGTPKDVEETIRAATKEYYRIPDDDIVKVDSVLSPAGWLTVADITEETGFSRNAVTKTLKCVEGVDKMCVGASTLYRRMPNYD